jgi:hypothetical protein
MQHGVRTVAMESTGNYWKNLFVTPDGAKLYLAKDGYDSLYVYALCGILPTLIDNVSNVPC